MKISSLFRGRSDVTPLATVCVSGHLVSTPLANVPWLVSLTAPATALDGVRRALPRLWQLYILRLASCL